MRTVRTGRHARPHPTPIVDGPPCHGRKESTMSLRRFALAVPILALFPAGAAAERVPAATAPAQVVVRNDTYSSLRIAIIDEAGRESSLGQAPPEFSNTLLIKEPLPDGPVRFLARLVGESEVLYRSEERRVGKEWGFW